MFIHTILGNNGTPKKEIPVSLVAVVSMPDIFDPKPQSPAFRDRYRWRAGIEGTISRLPVQKVKSAFPLILVGWDKFPISGQAC